MSSYIETLAKRRKSRVVKLGSHYIGGDHPITVQSMTNTLTSDTLATINQIKKLEEVGCDIVRLSCPDEDSTRSLKTIIKATNLPIVADIHFHYKRAIEAAQAGAACLRINPGNIGSRDRIKEVVQAAKDFNCVIRIGVNLGSLEKEIQAKYPKICPEALSESALTHIKILEDLDFFNMKVSVKASDVAFCVRAYELLAKACDYPLHLGITEAGSLSTGTVKSSMGIGCLLMNGIGDTLRVSLAADPCEEVRVGFEILKALHLRKRGVTIIACPSCARQQFDVIQTVNALEARFSHVVTPITVSIIGCVVNGPGEAKSSDIGLAGGGKGIHQLYIKGIPFERTQGDNLIEYLSEKIQAYLQKIEQNVA